MDMDLVMIAKEIREQHYPCIIGNVIFERIIRTW